MIADLKPYAEYKDSGLPWLGQVPERWSVQRTKWQFRHRKELNVDSNHTNVLSLTLRGVVNNNPDDPEGLVPKDYRTYQFFAKGDLVFKLIDLENLRTSRVGLVHEDGIMSSAYVRLVPTSSTNMRYFFHQFYDLYARGIYNQLGAGVRSTLNSSDLLNVGIAIPPPGEQAAIVRFLDWANGRLERAIRAKRKVIGLLDEQKKSIIHRAVTLGLDPSAPLKPSGVVGVRGIPKHWEERRLRTLTTEAITNGVGESAQVFREDWPRYVRITDIGNTFALRDSTRASLPPSLAKGAVLRAGDLLIAAVGATFGKAYVHTQNEEACFAGYLVRVRLGKMLNPLFAGYWTESQHYWTQLRANVIQSTIQNFSAARVKRLLAVVPPIAEQASIVAFVSEETSDLNILISRLEREIQLLREYRTRLVADVVTGKLDVREAAARLPEEVPLDTVEDDADLGEDLDIADEEATA